jgi:regulator of protease activity HflC (stomatin/prohibitin superfamily)
MTQHPNTGSDNESGATRGARSVMLRQEGAEFEGSAALDPANQSLADSLRIMLVLLQLAMVVLAGVYVASGFQSVKENERGIRVLFGRVEASNIEPGFAWSAPFPLGELRKVSIGTQTHEIGRDFWPSYTGDDASIDKLIAAPSLKPGQDGCILTGDGSIVHARWKVEYHIRNPADYEQNVGSKESERKLVEVAVKRAVVHACAQLSIDEVLAQGGEGPASLRGMIRSRAQDVLDSLRSGIQIDQVSTTLPIIPPKFIMSEFAKAQAAVSNASRAVEEARSEAGQTLAKVAGQVAPYLIERITAYEAETARKAAALEAGDAAMAAAADAELRTILQSIEKLLMGEPVFYPGGVVEAAGVTVTLPPGEVRSLTGGEMARLLGEAASYRTTVVNRARADLRRFQAKLAQYSANPRLMIQQELAAARLAFLNHDTVQQFLLPPGMSNITLLINYDPDVAREIQRAQKERERIKTEQERERMLKEEKFKTETGLQATPG